MGEDLLYVLFLTHNGYLQRDCSVLYHVYGNLQNAKFFRSRDSAEALRRKLLNRYTIKPDALTVYGVELTTVSLVEVISGKDESTEEDINTGGGQPGGAA